MNIIKKGYTRVTKIIDKKKLSNEVLYRISLFTYLHSENGRYLIQNTLTFEVTELTEQEWNTVRKIKNKAVSYDFVILSGLEQLAMSRYIVEDDYNEVEQYQQAILLLKTISGQKKGIVNYVILPTTGCNARCVYCYEYGYPVKTMTLEIADRLVDFIFNTRHNGIVRLKWFGGEPLTSAKIIRHICVALRQKGVPFRSEMVTNASLMTQELAYEAKTLWHLKKVQISLDGTKEDYMTRKNYYIPKKHNYEVVMRAIHFLADEGIKINLRVNVDFENFVRIPAFLQEIKINFGKYKNISLYIAPLFQEQRGNMCEKLYKEIFKLTDLQNELGIPNSITDEHRTIRLKMNFCMADSIENSIVIAPDGIFNNCEHLPKAQTWGNIFEGVTDRVKFNELNSPLPVDAKCAKCPFLPQCTPFYKSGCPGWFEKCYEYHCMKTEYSLHKLLKETARKDYDNDEKI